jgi:hypothetical protein
VSAFASTATIEGLASFFQVVDSIRLSVAAATFAYHNVRVFDGDDAKNIILNGSL